LQSIKWLKNRHIVTYIQLSDRRKGIIEKQVPAQLSCSISSVEFDLSSESQFTTLKV